MPGLELFGGAHVDPHGVALVHHLDGFAGTDGRALAALAQGGNRQHHAGDHGDADDEDIVFIEQELQKIHGAS
ncbi:hypothetical protein FQZ97_1237490 [compost metagenome]